MNRGTNVIDEESGSRTIPPAPVTKAAFIVGFFRCLEVSLSKCYNRHRYDCSQMLEVGKTGHERVMPVSAKRTEIYASYFILLQPLKDISMVNDEINPEHTIPFGLWTVGNNGRETVSRVDSVTVLAKVGVR
jgi:hypothetical protein